MSTRVEERKESREGLKAALSRQPVVAAVDLGASKVTCFIMKPEGVRRGDRTLTAAGVGYVQSRGVRGGAIINLDEASDAIAQAVERAENVAGVQVQPGPAGRAVMAAPVGTANVTVVVSPAGKALGPALFTPRV